MPYSKFKRLGLYITNEFCIASGAPADLYDSENPDWAPNMNLGHSKFVSNERQVMKSLERYERQSKQHVNTGEI